MQNLNYGLDVKSKKFGKVIRFLPVFEFKNKGLNKSVNLIIDSANSRSEKNYSSRLLNELGDIYYKKGISMERKKDLFTNFFLLKTTNRLGKFERTKKSYKRNYLKFARYPRWLNKKIKLFKKKIIFKKYKITSKFKKNEKFVELNQKNIKKKYQKKKYLN